MARMKTTKRRTVDLAARRRKERQATMNKMYHTMTKRQAYRADRFPRARLDNRAISALGVVLNQTAANNVAHLAANVGRLARLADNEQLLAT